MKEIVNQLKRDFPRMDSRYVQRLADLGFRDRSHVEDVARGLPDSDKLIAACLEVDQEALLRALGWSRWPEPCGVSLSGPCPLGGVLAPPDDMESVSGGLPRIVTRKKIPDHASLAKRFQAARDQLAVGTCTAFGSTGVLEAQYGPIDLSEAFVYSITKSIDGHPDTDGSWLKYAMRVVAEHGSSLESTWPYRDNREYLRQRPSAAAFAEARRYRSNPPQAVAVDAKDVDQIRATVADGRAVAVSLPIFKSSFASLRFHSEGRFLMKLGIFDSVAGYHAMCVVAYVDNAHLARHGLSEELGGGAFLLRNSWGTRWAKDNSLAAHLGAGPGYAIVPYGYVAAYCFEAFTLPAVTAGIEPAARVAKQLQAVGHAWWSRTRYAIVAEARQRLSSLVRS